MTPCVALFVGTVAIEKLTHAYEVVCMYCQSLWHHSIRAHICCNNQFFKWFKNIYITWLFLRIRLVRLFIIATNPTSTANSFLHHTLLVIQWAGLLLLPRACLYCVGHLKAAFIFSWLYSSKCLITFTYWTGVKII